MKKIVWIMIVVVAVLVIWGLVKKSGNLSYGPSPSPSPSPSASRASDRARQTQTYSKLVEQYAAKRIQFDKGCQAIPNSATYKTNVAVMFDNRSGDARTIKIGDVSYYFAGYGYKILTLSSPTLPKTLYLSCGSAVNVGTILLQK